MRIIACVLGLGLTTWVQAQQTPAQTQEQRERAARAAQQREQMRHAPDVRLQPVMAKGFRAIALPQESPCFALRALSLEGARHEAFGFLQRYLDRYTGRCVGRQGLALIVHRASDLLLARGYVTTRLATPEQNLSHGHLRLLLVPGLVGRVRFAPGSDHIAWRNALPLRPGDLLDLRAIEQGLEQMKRLSSQDVKIDIAPGREPGTSDLVLTVRRGTPWHVTLNYDDSGSNATGREQGGVNLVLDHPLGINDVFVAGVTHAAGRDGPEHNTRGSNFSYSLPWGDWIFSASTNAYGYRQPVTGSLQTFSFTGRSRTSSLNVSRMVHRDARSKTSVQFTLSGRQAHSYVDGVEIGVQRRQTRSVELALVHRRYLGQAQLDLRLAYRRNVAWFGGDWTASVNGGPTFRTGIATLDTSLGLPFRIGAQPWLWTSELHVQGTGDQVYVEDYVTVAGRYTVRGFDGERTLGGPHGAYWRNTLAWLIGRSGIALYGGVDVGRAGGTPTPGITRHVVSGAVLGVRGSRGGLSWDLFAGWALQAPSGFGTRRPAAGMQWIYSY